jgi:probable addiction module antidote protein
MRKNKSYKEHLLERLQTPDEITGYINAVIEENDIPTFLRALRNVAEAQGLGKVAEQAKLNRENVYRMLSEKGNPTINSLFSVLFVLGLGLRVETLPDRIPSVNPVNKVATKLLGGENDPEQFQPVSGHGQGLPYECTVPTDDESVAA